MRSQTITTVRAKSMIQRMMTNLLAKSLESPMTKEIDRPTVPSALVSTPKRTVKTSSSVNLSLLPTSETISPDLPQINRLEATTTEAMTIQDLRDMNVKKGIEATPEVTTTAILDHNIAKADTIIDPTGTRRMLIVDSPKLILSHLNTRAGIETSRKVPISHLEGTKSREETNNKLMIDRMTIVKT